MELEKIIKILMQVMCINENEIHYNSTLKEDLGADSLDMYDVFNAIEKEFHIVIKSDDFDKIRTVEDIVKMIV